MRSLDETDFDILRLLVEDARRPYSDIADSVDVSAPTVSDRIDRLRDLGVIDGFTVDLDRSAFTDGVDVLIDIDLRVPVDDRLVDRLASLEQVEHVFSTADARMFVVGMVRPDQVRGVLSDGIDLELVDSYRVHIVDEHIWAPSVGGTELGHPCAECSETITGEALTLGLDDSVYHFCSSDCRSTFEDRRVSLTESA